jgi:hypothetical protein
MKKQILHHGRAFSDRDSRDTGEKTLKVRGLGHVQEGAGRADRRNIAMIAPAGKQHPAQPCSSQLHSSSVYQLRTFQWDIS